MRDGVPDIRSREYNENFDKIHADGGRSFHSNRIAAGLLRRKGMIIPGIIR
jgi:hypothetical protein